MSQVLRMVCVECREEMLIGKVYQSAGTDSVWGIAHIESLAVPTDYFMLAHRGHVLGLVDDATSDLASDMEEIVATYTLEEVQARHPDLGLDDADQLGPAGATLARLLGISE